MATKASANRIIAVVCPTCGYADQVVSNDTNSHTCPNCEEEMIAETLTTQSTAKRRSLHVVTTDSKKGRKDGVSTAKKAKAMTKAKKVKDEPAPIVVAKPEPEKEISSVTREDAPVRAPLMTVGQIWSLYVEVMSCSSPEDIFDVFGRTFEDKWMLAWWNHRVGLGDLYTHYRNRDLVDFFRKVAHEIWHRRKVGEFPVQETVGSPLWIWRIHSEVMRAKDMDEIFDCFGRSVETRSEMTWWLNKTGNGQLVQLGRGHDFIEYLRKVAHELWNERNRKR